MSTYSDSQRPLGDVRYNQINASTPGYDPYTSYKPPKKRRSKWLVIGLPLLIILIIIGAVVGGVLGSRKGSSNTSSSGSGGSGGSNGGSGNVDGAHSSILHQQGRFAYTTDAYFNPVYPSTTDTAQFATPTFVDANNPSINWPDDTFTSSSPSLANLRPDRPRLIAGKHKINALPTLMAGDPYLKGWHDIIMNNATVYSNLPPVVHVFDGGPSGSGILDPAREVKQRIKHFAYAYVMTSDTAWVDRTWRELQNAVTWASDTSNPDNDPADQWNSKHFLDLAELTAAYAIAYDWLYDQWTTDQRNTIRSNIVTYGLTFGVAAYSQNAFWQSVNGNWNCVSNAGLIMGCIAIQGDDDSGICNTLLNQALTNAAANCVNVPTPSGSGSETPNYWYFALTGWSELTSTLQLATGGGDFGMLTNNPSFNLTALYHMYVTGMTSLFDYGDHGPNKFSTTDNCLFYIGSAYNIPMYTLWQRDRFTAAEPWSMFWYDPGVSGAWWDGLALDKLFDDDETRWGSMRTSWTDNDGMYVAMRASKLTGHQTHGDLDGGDFVLDALGERWAGELGSADYLGNGYFSSEAQDSVRWLWYRKMTEGQNTLSIAGANQNVNAQPVVKFDSSGTAQGSSTVMDIPTDSTAYMTADLSTNYGQNIKRGIRFFNGRRQVLLQDELAGVNAVTYWRMHTNATVTIDGNNANLSLNGKNLQVQLISPPTGVSWATVEPVRTADAPQLQTGQEADQPNPGVTVLSLSIPASADTTTIQVIFNPQWDGFSSFNTPALVALDAWSLTSH
ncbi:hypothetical protein M408DRAFT_325905 [Serendipita vermifera MAFF 305830]|uniref:Heparinase II/III-like C-terminal domain-containing protein n=1 Tax=Serendipita vermifera MAFF 305830 TaxID=933852 RepID=A0A0C2X923_SERVB|nr:hypothetical protein M408DRAFT_325905 [Serendipita vermifera MAFF 305830]